MKRNDDFETRRAHLAGMSDDGLKAYFWELAGRLTEPLLKMGREYTSPSIERSVLLRMGFSSLEVKPIVDTAIEKNLIAHGAGNIVYRVSRETGLGIRETGLKLAQGELWDKAAELFEEVRA